jgi:hypothetical protein
VYQVLEPVLLEKNKAEEALQVSIPAVASNGPLMFLLFQVFRTSKLEDAALRKSDSVLCNFVPECAGSG